MPYSSQTLGGWPEYYGHFSPVFSYQTCISQVNIGFGRLGKDGENAQSTTLIISNTSTPRVRQPGVRWYAHLQLRSEHDLGVYATLFWRLDGLSRERQEGRHQTLNQGSG